MDPISLLCLHHGSINICCLQYGATRLTLFTLWHKYTYAVYNMDPLTLSCLWNGPIKLMLLTVWTRQAYDF
jgi:hypothetical protein